MRKYRKRAREISLKYSSLSGQISSKKLNQVVQFESSLERDFIYLLEFDYRVKKYLEQPIKIPYKDVSGQIRSYIPDFIISYHDKFRKNEIIEIKYEKELNKKSKELKHKFQAARQYCINNDMIFRICSDNYIRKEKATLLRNAKFLAKFRDYYENINYQTTGVVVNTNNAHKIIRHLKKVNSCSINEMIEFISKGNSDKYLKAKLIFLIWYLIANNFVYSDLESWLNFDSQIEVWTDLK